MNQAYDDQITSWLLTSAIPSIRLLTLRDLKGLPEMDSRVKDVFQEMKVSGPIPAILSEQTSAGNWAHERGYYTPKYTSTHWSMLLMAELAADVLDTRLRQGADYMLAATQKGLEIHLQKRGSGWTCFYGNLLRYALHFGFQDDDRIAAIKEFLVGEALEADWCCPYNFDLPCAWGAARALWGLALLPSEQRAGKVGEAIRHGVAFLLDRYPLVAASYPTEGSVHPLWFRLNFPLFYQVDILFVLRVLAELGQLEHPQAQPALEWLVEQRKENGHWRGANPFRRRTWSVLSDAEDTNRWVTLHAVNIIKKSRNGKISK
ncbi:MAG: hypothetical protein MUO64_21155 [Anaerolineales bacterium]|nr:hypothetical protein [Anaerolineales bacterium]